MLIMGIGNIGNMMKVMNAWNTFKQNHPKFPAFCSAVSRRGIREGSILEVTYISPEGEKLTHRRSLMCVPLRWVSAC